MNSPEYTILYRRRRKSSKIKASRSRINITKLKNSTHNLVELKCNLRVGRRAEMTVL